MINADEVIKKVAAIDQELGREIENLWLEFEARESFESKIAQACDKLDPMFLRIQANQSLKLEGVDVARLDSVKLSYFQFSKVLMSYYEKLKVEMQAAGLL